MGHKRADNVEGGGHPKGGDTEADIADGAAPDGHGNAADETAKPVEMLGGGMADAGNGKRKGAYKLNDVLERSHKLRILVQHGSYFWFFSSNLSPQQVFIH